MIRYTARHGTTFHFDPDCHALQVLGADAEGLAVELDLEDLREFLQYVDDRTEAVSEEDVPCDGDTAAVGAD
jgi:hypothetical protein